MNFPDDENGDTLRRIEAKGDDFRARDVDFNVVFPDEELAERFAVELRDVGYRASVGLSHVRADAPWDVRVVRHMELSHEQIGEFENLLERIAAPFGGYNDGWGCFAGPTFYGD
jgi:hypothetical protein